MSMHLNTTCYTYTQKYIMLQAAIINSIWSYKSKRGIYSRDSTDYEEKFTIHSLAR